MISYALSLEGFAYVVGVELDVDAAYDAVSSPLYRQLASVDFIVADARRPPLRRLDCVVQNPPFGLRSRRGLDREFIEAAASLSARVIVSLHHAGKGVLDFLKRLCLSLGYELRLADIVSFPLPQLYSDHWKRIHYIKALAIACVKGSL